MKRTFLSLLLVILVSGCGGGDSNVGGGGTSVAGASTPALYSVVLSPSEPSISAQTPVYARIDVADAGGDLNGGAFYYAVENFSEDHLLLPESLAGLTTRQFSVPLQFPLNLRSTVPGTLRIKCHVKDRRGFSSNTVTVSLTQKP